MTYEIYMEIALAGKLPPSPIVPLPSQPFVDGRGVIQNLMLHSMDSITVITSTRGSVRANHYHNDFHFSYLVSGKVAYYERDVGVKAIPSPTIITQGMMFFSPANREHSMLFLEDSVFITFQNSVRTHDNHESNVKRVDFIDPKKMGF